MLILMMLVAAAMLMLTFVLIANPNWVSILEQSIGIVTFPPHHVESTHKQPDKMIWRQVPL